MISIYLFAFFRVPVSCVKYGLLATCGYNFAPGAEDPLQLSRPCTDQDCVQWKYETCNNTRDIAKEMEPVWKKERGDVSSEEQKTWGSMIQRDDDSTSGATISFEVTQAVAVISVISLIFGNCCNLMK